MYRFACKLMHLDTSNPEQTTLINEFSIGSGDFPEHKITSPGIKLQIHGLVDSLIEKATNFNLPEVGKPAALADVVKSLTGFSKDLESKLEIYMHQTQTETILQIRLPV